MNYFLKIFSTGALRKTPEKVIRHISCLLDNREKSVIVEFGAGKGEITKKILKEHQHNIKKYYAFEFDSDLSQKLQAEIPQIKVFAKNAFEFDSFLNNRTNVDYFICSIPLSFYTVQKVEDLLKKMDQKLNPDGSIIIIFNAFWLLSTLKKAGGKITFNVFRTFPIYFLYHYQKV